MVMTPTIHAKHIREHLPGPMVDSDRGLGGPLSEKVAGQTVADLLVGQLVDADVVLDGCGQDY